MPVLMLCMTGALLPSRIELLNRTSCFSRYSARWPAIFGNPGETLSPLGPWHDAQTWEAYLPTSASCARRDGAMHAIVIVTSEIGTITSVLIFVCLMLEGFLRSIEPPAIRFRNVAP